MINGNIWWTIGADLDYEMATIGVFKSIYQMGLYTNSKNVSYMCEQIYAEKMGWIK